MWVPGPPLVSRCGAEIRESSQESPPSWLTPDSQSPSWTIASSNDPCLGALFWLLGFPFPLVLSLDEIIPVIIYFTAISINNPE